MARSAARVSGYSIGPRSVTVKVILPGEVRDALFGAARKAGLSASAFARSVLIQRLARPQAPVRVAGGFLDPDPLPLPR